MIAVVWGLRMIEEHAQVDQPTEPVPTTHPIYVSLIPRLPPSGTWTLKLYNFRVGKPGNKYVTIASTAPLKHSSCMCTLLHTDISIWIYTQGDTLPQKETGKPIINTICCTHTKYSIKGTYMYIMHTTYLPTQLTQNTRFQLGKRNTVQCNLDLYAF